MSFEFQTEAKNKNERIVIDISLKNKSTQSMYAISQITCLSRPLTERKTQNTIKRFEQVNKKLLEQETTNKQKTLEQIIANENQKSSTKK